MFNSAVHNSAKPFFYIYDDIKWVLFKITVSIRFSPQNKDTVCKFFLWPQMSLKDPYSTGMQQGWKKIRKNPKCWWMIYRYLLLYVIYRFKSEGSNTIVIPAPILIWKFPCLGRPGKLDRYQLQASLLEAVQRNNQLQQRPFDRKVEATAP